MIEAIKIKKLAPGALMPKRATDGSAGFDICAMIESPVELAPGESALIPTGLAIEMPRGCVALCFARSGLAIKHGVCLSNGVGVIDSDYRGEVKVGLVNLGKESYTLYPGDRMAQIIVMQPYGGAIEEAEELSETERGEGGFGSTGRSGGCGNE